MLHCAAGLAALGVAREFPVSWQLPTRIDALVLAGALARLGAVQNPILPILREREVGFIVRQIGARHLFVPRAFRGFDFEAMAKQAAAQQPGLGARHTDHSVACRGRRFICPDVGRRSREELGVRGWVLGRVQRV